MRLTNRSQTVQQSLTTRSRRSLAASEVETELPEVIEAQQAGDEQAVEVADDEIEAVPAAPATQDDRMEQD